MGIDPFDNSNAVTVKFRSPPYVDLCGLSERGCARRSIRAADKRI
jgi:hypothetical protein